ncbi:hypothetical protein [Gloeobacter violaceus]|uniref:Glr2607 protein n=1 Tax=Gloeobacter violaceus (strain ATCC 29082 / PCC 7421) TaxID=251221 RepID=Q7NHD0_GLOVI|nr:hypothetical protein [Gloeobacter violaceus]BAC90548.1 glr2607 [Gloeobacter violaceus PCC 7421]
MSSNWFRNLLMFDGFLAPEREVHSEAPRTQPKAAARAALAVAPEQPKKPSPQIGPAIVPEEREASVVAAVVETELEKPQAEPPLEAQPVADWQRILGWTGRD